MSDSQPLVSMVGDSTVSIEELRKMRKKNRGDKDDNRPAKRRLFDSTSTPKDVLGDQPKPNFTKLLDGPEEKLLAVTSDLNNVYHLMEKKAPFSTFALTGMQSTGKSTLLERLLGTPINIVQDSTGTRCPLYVTCIYDESCDNPICELQGKELEGRSHEDQTVQEVFKRINRHTKNLSDDQAFSLVPLFLTYRAANVQNMRVVDTPGIITTASKGEQDNREEIKDMLRKLLQEPNTKLCPLLEPKEFDTNGIIEFLDDTFGSRDKWIRDAIGIMTKFDKQRGDTCTGTRANSFLKKFEDNGLSVYLVYTPIVEKSNLNDQQLWAERTRILATAEEEEKGLFRDWVSGHEKRHQRDSSEELLSAAMMNRLGFAAAKKRMREVLLENIRDKLPDVVVELKQILIGLEKKREGYKKREELCNEKTLKKVSSEVMYEVVTKMIGYLDGNLQGSMNNKAEMKTLENEICDEEDSEWRQRELNHYTPQEDGWRLRIASFEGEYPDSIQPEQPLQGGKQVQRAFDFFSQVMIKALPDPQDFEGLIANCTGFLSGGLKRENWERAMVQIVQVCVQKTCHPGINYLIKHVGCIFRNLFSLALEDVMHGERLSATFQLLPTSLFRFIQTKFDQLLWEVMQNAANMTHNALEPMYETINPKLLSNYRALDTSQKYYIKNDDGEFVEVNSEEGEGETKESALTTFRESAKESLNNFNDTKKMLVKEASSEAKSKSCILPEERTAMVTGDECCVILHRAYDYMIALMDNSLVINLNFQLNKHLYNDFKEELSKNFKKTTMEEAPWDQLTKMSPEFQASLDQVEAELEAVKKGLQAVYDLQKMME